MTLAEAARMTWPFGGLPIGGVFLGQAGGPVLGLARLGGPLALTAAVYLGGVGVGALAEWVVRSVRGGHRSRVFSRSQWALADRQRVGRRRDRPGSGTLFAWASCASSWWPARWPWPTTRPTADRPIGRVRRPPSKGVANGASTIAGGAGLVF